MADLSLDEIIATKQGLNPNITKPFQGRPGLQRAQPISITPVSPPKPSQPSIIQLKRAVTAPGPKPNKPASHVVTKRAQTPNTAKSKNGQMDARDMISIKNRIKMGDARSKIIQKRLSRINANNPLLQPLMRPLFAMGPGGRCPVPGPGIQPSFPPPLQPGLGPPPRPPRPPGPQRFPPPGQGPPFQQPRPQQPRPQQPPGMNQQRPPQFNPGQRPPFNRPRPPFNKQGPPMNLQNRPPMNQQNRPPFNPQQQPFNQQQRPPFNQQPPNFNQQPPNLSEQPPNFNRQPPNLSQQPPNFSQQPPDFCDQPDFNQQPPDFNEQPPDFNQQPPEFLQQPPDFIPEEPMGFMEPPPDFNQDQGPPLFQEQAMPFNAPDGSFGQQPPQLGPGDPSMSQDGPAPFGQQGPPGQQMNPGGPPFSQPPPLMNQPPPNFSHPLPNPKVPPPNFNQPPPNQAFNLRPNLDHPPPNFNQRPPDVRQPPPGFGLPLPNLQQPPPGFHPMGDEEDGDEGFMTMGNGRTLVEDTGTSLKITRTIPEVSFDGQSLTVTRRVPEGDHYEGNVPVQVFTPRGPTVHPNQPPPKKKFQPVPVKAPSPAPQSNIVKTGGPTLNKKANNGNRVPAARRNPGLVPNSMPPPSRPGPIRAGNTVTNTHMASMNTETVSSAAPITRTLHIPPQQPPPRLNPPQSTGSVFSRIQLPSQPPRSNPPPPSSGSVFSRIQLQAQTAKPPPRVQQSHGQGNVMSRLSAPTVPITKRLAPPPSMPPPQPQPARVPQVPTRVPQVSTRVAVKRPAAMSLSERFSSGGGSGNPIPVITDHSSVKKRRPSEPEDARADFGRSFQSESVPEIMTEQQDAGVTVLSPLQGYRVLVSNLHSSVTQDDVIELFGALGPLKRANLLAKGQAELAFIHKEHALLALKTYHNRELDGQPMFVKLTTPMNAKVLQPSDDSPPVTLPPNLRSKKPPTPSSAPVEIPLIHKALFKTGTDGAPPKAVRFTVKL